MLPPLIAAFDNTDNEQPTTEDVEEYVYVNVACECQCHCCGLLTPSAYVPPFPFNPDV